MTSFETKKVSDLIEEHFFKNPENCTENIFPELNDEFDEKWFYENFDNHKGNVISFLSNHGTVLYRYIDDIFGIITKLCEKYPDYRGLLYWTEEGFNRKGKKYYSTKFFKTHPVKFLPCDLFHPDLFRGKFKLNGCGIFVVKKDFNFILSDISDGLEDPISIYDDLSKQLKKAMDENDLKTINESIKKINLVLKYIKPKTVEDSESSNDE